MRLDKIPLNYLGVPLCKGRPLVSYLFPIADQFDAWKGMVLSFKLKAYLINLVIVFKLVCLFIIYTWLVALLKHMNGAIKNYF